MVLLVLQLGQHERVVPRQPAHVTCVVHAEDVRLDSRHLSRILRHQMDDVEDIAPEVVVLADVPIEAPLAQLVEDEPVLVADEADVFRVHLQVLLLFSHLCEGVNDDTEEDVEQDDVD